MKTTVELHFEEQAEAYRNEFSQMWVQWRDVLENDFRLRDKRYLAGAELIAWRAFLHLKAKGAK